MVTDSSDRPGVAGRITLDSRGRPSRGLAGMAACLLGIGCTGTVDGASSGGDGTTPAGSGAGSAAGASASGAGAAGGAPGQGGTGPAGSAGSGAASGGGSGATGSAGTGATAGAPPVYQNPPPFQAAPGLLRRLTRNQFRNAVRDVFGVDVDTSELDTDSYNGNFAVIGASTVVTSERGVEQYHTAIESAVDTVLADAARQAAFIGCTPGTGTNDACVRGFVQSMGRRAWRRPLETAEVDRLMAVAENATSELGSAIEGVRWATVELFTSPNFLYRAELGAPSTGGALRFTGYETASRLAFLVWNSLADETLLDEAASGALATPDGIRNAAARLLEAPAGRESVGAFAEEYLRLDRIATQAKDASLFAEYGPALQAAMVRDMRDVWEVLAFDDRTSAMDVFSTPKVVVNLDLAQLYGIDTTGLTASTFAVRSLPADGPRLGLLSKAGFASAFANQKAGSPTLRGKFIREALLCTPVEPPPGNVPVLEDPPVDQPMTKRQQLEMHRSNPTCAGCHSMMDPLGLPLESFDAIGRYRTTDHGLPIDPSGDFEGQPVADARELGFAVASSLEVAQCMVRKYYSYALGYEERDVDGSVVNDLAASFQASGFQLRDLVLDIVTSDAFSSVAPQP